MEMLLEEFRQTFLVEFWPFAWKFLLELILAIIIFFVGWFIAVGIGKLIAEVLKRIKFNQVFERGGWKRALEKAEIKIDPSAFVGLIVKWILAIVFLQIAVGIMGWASFELVLRDIVGYLPNVAVAVLIFVVTVILVDIVEKVVRTAVEGMKVGFGHIVSAIVKWSIWIFAIFTILEQLIPNSQTFTVLFQSLITGIIAFLVISLGLAFGLGGKEVAGDMLQDLRKKLKG